MSDFSELPKQTVVNLLEVTGPDPAEFNPYKYGRWVSRNCNKSASAWKQAKRKRRYNTRSLNYIIYERRLSVVNGITNFEHPV